METIAAISTAAGVGGIGIIRISGDKSFEIISKIFKCKNKDIDYNSDDSTIDIKLDEPENPQDKELTNIIEKNTIVHSYLFTGKSGNGSGGRQSVDPDAAGRSKRQQDDSP